jgi:hypothetical protein
MKGAVIVTELRSGSTYSGRSRKHLMALNM